MQGGAGGAPTSSAPGWMPQQVTGSGDGSCPACRPRSYSPVPRCRHRHHPSILGCSWRALAAIREPRRLGHCFPSYAALVAPRSCAQTPNCCCCPAPTRSPPARAGAGPCPRALHRPRDPVAHPGAEGTRWPRGLAQPLRQPFGGQSPRPCNLLQYPAASLDNHVPPGEQPSGTLGRPGSTRLRHRQRLLSEAEGGNPRRSRSGSAHQLQDGQTRGGGGSALAFPSFSFAKK